ncbi:MAG: hypothetical protein VB878_15075, partial [Pirellulaceae bacterium]
WRAVLRRYRLPEELTPKSIKKLIDSHSHVAELRRQLAEKHRDRGHRLEDVERLKQRLEEIILEVGIEFQSDDPHELLRELSGCLAEQRRLVDRRNVLRKRDKELEKQRAKYHNSVERTKLRKQAVISRHGVEEESDLRDLAAQLSRFLGYENEHRDLCERIRVLIGRQFTEEEIAETLDCDGSLETNWEKCATEVEELQEQIGQLHTKQGEVQHEMKMLAADRDLARASVAIQAVVAKIDRLKKEWQLLASIGYVLESIRKIYETERQPESLNDASRYLSNFTEGKYTRIWTPLGENVLRVDDAQGNPLSVETLSTGTREAVFLSLRMALVAAYARRGVVLPLILDDVMVNLDVHRAKAAVDVLHTFAEAGHQVLLFTCHEHIMRMFVAAGVEVRSLPSHSDLKSKRIGLLSAMNVGLTRADVEVIDDVAADCETLVGEMDDSIVEEGTVVQSDAEVDDEFEEAACDEVEDELDDELEDEDELEDLTEAELEQDEVQKDDHSNPARMPEDATDDVRNDERPIGELERQAAKLIAQTSELLNEYSQVGEEATDSKPQRRATHALTPNAADMWWDIDEA